MKPTKVKFISLFLNLFLTSLRHERVATYAIKLIQANSSHSPSQSDYSAIIHQQIFISVKFIVN